MPQDIDTKSCGLPCFSQFSVVNFSVQIPFPCVNSCVHQMLNYSVMSIVLSLHPLCLIIAVTSAVDYLSGVNRVYVGLFFCCPLR